jgi:hypothetical protein
VPVKEEEEDNRMINLGTLIFSNWEGFVLGQR